MKDAVNRRWLSVHRTIALLKKLPKSCRVLPSRTGDLLILSEDGTQAVAYVDFSGTGSVEDLLTESTTVSA